jgi:hypothetical protein
VIRYGRRVSRQDAEKTAAGFMKGLSAQLKPVQTWDSTRGPFVGKAGIFVDEHAAASSRKEHKAFIQVLVSPETSTLCIVSFDAPSRARTARSTHDLSSRRSCAFTAPCWLPAPRPAGGSPACSTRPDRRSA